MKIILNSKISTILLVLLISQNFVIAQQHIWKTIFNKENSTILCISNYDENNLMMSFTQLDTTLRKTKVYLAKSTNAGFTWEYSEKPKHDGYTTAFYTIEHVSENNIFVGAAGSIIFKTKDGGKTWESVKLLTDSIYGKYIDLRYLSMYDQKHGIALIQTIDTSYQFTDSSKLSILLYTNDSWKSWRRIKVPGYIVNFKEAAQGWLPTILCLDINTMIVKIVEIDGEHFLISRDTGTTWNKLPVQFENYGVKNTSLYKSLNFLDSKTGYVMGQIGVDSGFIKLMFSKTTDGGYTWNNQFLSKIDLQYISNANDFRVVKENQYLIDGPIVSRCLDLGKTWIKDTIEGIPNTGRLRSWPKSRRGGYSGYMVLVDKIIKDFGEFTPVNIVEYGRAINVSISPNPAESRIEIGLAGEGSGKVLLYNTLGSLVLEQPYSQSNHVSLDVSTLAVGCYNAVIENEKERITKKIIVSR